MIRRRSSFVLAGWLIAAAACAHAAKPAYVQILKRDGTQAEARLTTASLAITVDDKPRDIRCSDILSIHFGADPSSSEKDHFAEWIAAITGKDGPAAEVAAEHIVDAGLPALTAMLKAQDPTDTDLHEPHLLYSLFSRIMPPGGDRLDRTLDMVRLVDGTVLRGKLVTGSLSVVGADGKAAAIPYEEIRRIAIRRPVVTRTLAVDSLRHCTQIEWLDTGVTITKGSHVESNAEGIVRLSFDLDKWTATPDALIRPDATGQKRVIDGFNFGALLGKVGAAGERMMLGSHAAKDAAGEGRFYLAINDNGHWQNNIGAYRVKLRITNAYDVGEAAP